MSKGHPLARLIVKNLHEDNFHTGREHTLATSRKWRGIPNCRGMIRQILNDCITCKRDRETPQHPLMGDLPKERVESGGKLFRNTGVDYFGSYLVKRSKKARSNTGLAKRYGVLFTCLTKRETHIELARDLSTDSFLLALRGFISRRVHIQVMRLDNGTNFVVANNELKL